MATDDLDDARVLASLSRILNDGAPYVALPGVDPATFLPPDPMVEAFRTELVDTGRLSEANLSGTIGAVVEAEAPAIVAPLIEEGLGDVTVGTLKRFHAALAEDPTTVKIVIFGDSTTAGATDLFSVLRTQYTAVGMPLEGVPSANIVQGGNNGWALSTWLADADADNGAPYSYADLIADLPTDRPSLAIPSFGINDTRQNATTLAQLIARYESLRSRLAVDRPLADILFRMPNSLTTTVVGTDYVDGITHQAVTDILRAANLAMAGRWPNVVVADVQADIFGTQALPSSVLMADELHPSVAGYRAIAYYLMQFIAPQVRMVRVGPQASYRFARAGWIYTAGNGYIDLGGMPGSTDQPHTREWPVTASDTLYVGGVGVVSLSGSSFGAQGNSLRVVKTGDWSALAGKPFLVVGSHADLGASEGRYFATIDPGSVAAGAYLDVTTTITGITREMGVTVQPPSAIFSTGLLWSAAISADNTVTIRLYNPTASPIDMAGSSSWRFWILR